MKYVILGVIFIGVPLLLLNTLVLPELEKLETFYSNIDVTAQNVVSQK